MTRKCVVVHAGARDDYQLALAMSECGYLHKLVTELYCPDALTGILKSLADKRYKTGLSSRFVSMSATSMFATANMLIRKQSDLNRQKDAALSKLAYQRAKLGKSNLFCYSYYASYAFSQPRAFEGQQRLLFQLHPHPVSIRKILEEELILAPAAKNSILHENELQYSEDYLQQLSSESLLADNIVVASSFTRKTLTDHGVPDSKIKVIPYGIDASKYFKRTVRPNNERLRIIFVGSMVQRKGLSYLLESVRRITARHIELVLCGRGFTDTNLINEYSDVHFVIKRGLSHVKLIEELHQSDLFVLPSLSEGFAQVILEAMSCGLPVLTTTNSCGPDILTEGINGWVVSVRSVDKLVEKLEWSILNKTTLFDMGNVAAQTARQYSWPKFRNQVAEFYKNAVN